MNIKLIPIFLSVVFIVMFASCNLDTKIKNQNAELKTIENTISSSIGWFENKDFDLLFSVIANDSSFIEIHPTDRVVHGFEEFKKNSEFFKYEGFQYVRHELKDLNINISESGTVAWWFCILDDISTWDGQPTGWENTRWTGVLEKRDGKWVVVQQHFSFAS